MIEEANGITIEQTNSKANIVLDMSSWDLFELCKFRYHLRHNKLRGETIKAKALDIGGLMHEGMEVYYKLLANRTHFNDRVQAALTRIKVFSSDPENCQLDEEEIDTVLRVLPENVDYWRFEDEQFQILEVERPFAYVLYEDEYVRIIITGKIDLLVNWTNSRMNYQRLPIDHKTFQRDFEVPRLSNQFQNYCYAVESKFLYVNRIGLQKTLKPSEKFKRIPLSYDTDILNEWKNNLIDGILNEYLPCVASQKWRMNFTSCLKFNRKCEYYEICDTSGEENKAYKLESGFAALNPWDVTATFNKKK